MAAPGRFTAFAAVTLVGVVACAVISWLWVGPFWGLIFALTALTYAYKAVAKRFDPAGSWEGGLTVVTWWVFAVCCMIGGATGGSMQPRAAGPPWEMIGIGTAAGAVVGVILAGVTRALARLVPMPASGPAPRPPPPAS
jgi:hypothetical protein